MSLRIMLELDDRGNRDRHINIIFPCEGWIDVVNM
jgi:hypothetical protein